MKHRNISNLGDLMEANGLERNDTIERLSRAIYKGTECGGWVAMLPDTERTGVVIGTIVEGSDAEFSEHMEFPFTLKEWNDAWANIEALADEAWREANEEV